MTETNPVHHALIDLLITLDARPGNPISIYDIGVPLVGQGFTQDEILNALFWFDAKRVLKLLDGNRLEVLKPLT